MRAPQFDGALNWVHRFKKPKPTQVHKNIFWKFCSNSKDNLISTFQPESKMADWNIRKTVMRSFIISTWTKLKIAILAEWAKLDFVVSGFSDALIDTYIRDWNLYRSNGLLEDATPQNKSQFLFSFFESQSIWKSEMELIYRKSNICSILLV